MKNQDAVKSVGSFKRHSISSFIFLLLTSLALEQAAKNQKWRARHWRKKILWQMRECISWSWYHCVTTCDWKSKAQYPEDAIDSCHQSAIDLRTFESVHISTSRNHPLYYPKRNYHPWKQQKAPTYLIDHMLPVPNLLYTIQTHFSSMALVILIHWGLKFGVGKGYLLWLSRVALYGIWVVDNMASSVYSPPLTHF